MAKSKMPPKRKNPFEPRPPILPVGDSDPRSIVPLIGEVTTSWEAAEISYSYLFSTIVSPVAGSRAVRRAYGSVISARTRKEMIESAGELFFHVFPNADIEGDFLHLLKIYNSAASRRNDVAHGMIIAGTGTRTGWYLEANTYSTKRDVTFQTPYAYTSAQMKEMANKISRLQYDVQAFRDILKAHFLSFDPKLRAQYLPPRNWM
jgi:hypothetical protein